jgi:hypothetical protein
MDKREQWPGAGSFPGAGRGPLPGSGRVPDRGVVPEPESGLLPGSTPAGVPSPVPGRAPGPGPTPGFAPTWVPESDADGDFDEADGDFDEWVAWVDREVAAGRDPIPPERAPEIQGISISLGDAADIDPELLAAMCGPDGLGGPVPR